MPFCSRCGTELTPDSRFCSSCSAPVEAQPRTKETRRTFQVSGKPRVIVTHTAAGGFVEVKPGQPGEVNVRLEAERPDYLDWEFSQHGETVTVTCRQPLHRLLWAPFSGAMRADLYITTPRETDLDVENTVGSTFVSSLNGSIAARASVGQVEIHDCEGTIRARSETGRVLLTDIQGVVSASSAIGSIEFTGSLAPGDNWFKANTGSIRISLAGEPHLIVDAFTGLGNVTCDLPLADAHLGERRCSGRLGAGTGRLTAEANLGSITITRRR